MIIKLYNQLIKNKCGSIKKLKANFIVPLQPKTRQKSQNYPTYKIKSLACVRGGCLCAINRVCVSAQINVGERYVYIL